MDKTAIKNYAIWARRELIEKVSAKAAYYGITADNIVDANADSIEGRLLTEVEKKQRQALIRKVKEQGYEQVMEEVAYTWFNRFAALRFMEVNGYLPSHVRVFTNDEGEFKPQILSEAIHLDLDGLNKDKVYELKNANKSGELFKYLLIVQCNALNSILPGMFQKIEDYTELLLPDYLLREGSVIEQMVAMIQEEDWMDQVQIIGWLYQYYNTEPKDKVFADLKKNIKITKENIPAATQLFTPDWIVHYMVENSLGRLWLEGHPNNALKSEWKYYLDEAEQEAEVQAQLETIRKEYAALKPEEIRCIDPCMGSGHILCVLFDTLVRIYEDYGYTAREAAARIVENNLWGLDIDERAAQLSYFAVMMKARQYDRRFFNKRDEQGNLCISQPHVYAIEESNSIDPSCVEYFVNGRPELKSAIATIVKEMHDAKEYGSILNVTPVDFDALYSRFDELQNSETPDIFTYRVIDELLPLIRVAQALSQKYHTVVTNPPYMGGGSANSTLSNYLKENYNNSKMDMFAVFVEKCTQLTLRSCFSSLITQQALMFLSSFKNLRRELLLGNSISSMLHLGFGTFGADFGTVAFATRKLGADYNGAYFALSDVKTSEEKQVLFEKKLIEKDFFVSGRKMFFGLPNDIFAYWLSDNFVQVYAAKKTLGDTAPIKAGMKTGDNKRFLRLWSEVDITKEKFDCLTYDDIITSHKKWFPYNKGGESRMWYGNHDYVINMENGAAEIISQGREGDYRLRDKNNYFKQSLSWSFLTAGRFSIRYYPTGFLCDVAGSSIYPDQKDMHYLLAILASKVAYECLQIQNPTLNFQVENLSNIPYIDNLSNEEKQEITDLVEQCIYTSKEDWDNFETSWNFNSHPLVKLSGRGETLKKIFDRWNDVTTKAFFDQKRREERINELLIKSYGLSNDLSPDEQESDVNIRRADLTRDIKSLISYAVGCMFGRYSLDISGIAFAGGEWDTSKYTTFQPDKDAIIPICDDEYFEDDIVGRFVKFVDTVYGRETLEENLQFIADALGGKGAARDVIRNYGVVQ